jgi:hypothetical protein
MFPYQIQELKLQLRLFLYTDVDLCITKRRILTKDDVSGSHGSEYEGNSSVLLNRVVW